MKRKEFDKIRLFGKEHFWFIHRQRLISAITEMFNLHGDTILDIGCGTGVDLDLFHNIIGIDNDISAMKGNLGHIMINGDVNHLPLKSHMADIIISMDLIQHSGIDVPLALNEMMRILKPGGYIILNVPVLKILYSFHDLEVGNTRRFDPKEIDILLPHELKIRFASFWNILFLIPIFIRRIIFGSLISFKDRSDLQLSSKWMNSIILSILALETIFFKRMIIPIGVSKMYLIQRVPDE